MAQERTPETMAHGERVARYAVSVARALGALGSTGPMLDQLDRAARFHDIGKLAIPDSLLNKPSPLTPAEQSIVRHHVDAGAEILASGRTTHDLAAIALASHEWFGGGGYPLQMAGAAIPVASRIIGVVDAYDAMTQHRQHRQRLDSVEAVSELLRCSGTQFDPEVVDAFLTVLSRH
jgi:putative nucleotidyltransferase with HDIG domain